MIPALEPARRLGRCVIEPGRGRLTASGEAHRLEPRVMQVLLALSDRAGETVGREALIRAVWGDTAVTDDALQRCISVLRRTLGRGAHGVRIETIPKVGYRLVVDEAPPAASERGGPRLRAGVMLGGAAVVALATAIGAIWPRPAPPPAPKIEPLTTSPGHELSPSVSADGSHVAFIRRAGGASDLFVTVGQGPPLRLTDTASAAEHAPAYAPDGTAVAFARTEGGRCAVYRVAPIGGPETKLFTCAHADTTEIAWSPDGRRMAYVDRAAALAPRAARIIELDTGRVWGPPAPTGGLGDGDLAFSPDGRTLAFSRSPALGVEDVFLFALDTHAVTRVTRDNLKIHGLTYTGERHLVVSSNRLGPFGLWRVDVHDGTFARVPAVGRHHDSPSAAGQRLVYEAWSARVDLAAYAPAGDRWPLDGEPWGRIGSTHFDWNPAVGPDGRIAFVSDRSGSAEVWLADGPEAEPRPLTRFGGAYVQGPRWSPDGRTLVFAAPAAGNFDVYEVPAAGGPVVRLTTHSARDRVPSFSADGQSVYFASDRDGAFAVWRIDRARRSVERRFDGYAAVEADGWLYYTQAREDGLYRRPVEGGDAEVVVEDLTPVDVRNWVVRDGTVVYIERPTPPNPRLVRLDIETRAKVVLGAPERFYHHSGLDIDAGGRLWMARVLSSETDLYRIDLLESNR